MCSGLDIFSSIYIIFQLLRVATSTNNRFLCVRYFQQPTEGGTLNTFRYEELNPILLSQNIAERGIFFGPNKTEIMTMILIGIKFSQNESFACYRDNVNLNFHR